MKIMKFQSPSTISLNCLVNQPMITINSSWHIYGSINKRQRGELWEIRDYFREVHKLNIENPLRDKNPWAAYGNQQKFTMKIKGVRVPIA